MQSYWRWDGECGLIRDGMMGVVLLEMGWLVGVVLVECDGRHGGGGCLGEGTFGCGEES